MFSTARITEPPLSGLSGLVHSSGKAVKPGHASWLDKAKALNRPNPAIATKPLTDTVRTDYLKDDLEGQIATSENVNKPVKRKRKAPAKKRQKTKRGGVQKRRATSSAGVKAAVEKVLKNIARVKKNQSTKRKKPTRKRK